MNPYYKTILNFGAMSGLASFAFFILLYYCGINPLGPASYLGLWIPILFICFSTSRVRKTLYNGFISYGQAWRTGFLTATAAGALMALMLYIFGTMIQPGFLESYKTNLYEDLEKTKELIGENFYDLSMKGIEETTMQALSWNEFLLKGIGGAIVSLITAAVYKNPKPMQEVNP